MRKRIVGTPDGGHLRVYSFRDGPGVVMLCGTNTAASAYFATARRLSRTLPVHVYDRRGRTGSSLQPADYSMATEVADLGSVLDATGSTAIFGHSYGGAIALEAGLQLPVSRIALYDAVPNIGGAVPTHFLPEFESAVRRGHIRRAVSVLGKGISVELREGPIPDPAIQVIIWIMSIVTRTGRAWKSTVPSAVKELALLDGTRPAAERYSGITVPVMVLFGSRSDGFYRTIAKRLGGSLPDGRCIEISGADHGALDRAPTSLIGPLEKFYTGGGIIG